MHVHVPCVCARYRYDHTSYDRSFLTQHSHTSLPHRRDWLAAFNMRIPIPSDTEMIYTYVDTSVQHTTPRVNTASRGYVYPYLDRTCYIPYLSSHTQYHPSHPATHHADDPVSAFLSAFSIRFGRTPSSSLLYWCQQHRIVEILTVEMIHALAVYLAERCDEIKVKQGTHHIISGYPSLKGETPPTTTSSTSTSSSPTNTTSHDSTSAPSIPSSSSYTTTPPRILEVGSGSGRLSHFLNATGIIPYHVHATDLYLHPFKKHAGVFPVEQLGHSAGICRWCSCSCACGYMP